MPSIAWHRLHYHYAFGVSYYPPNNTSMYEDSGVLVFFFGFAELEFTFPPKEAR